MVELFEKLETAPLESLRIQNMDLTEIGVVSSLEYMLEKSKTLTVLDLKGCVLRKDSGVILMTSIYESPSLYLKHLCLSYLRPILVSEEFLQLICSYIMKTKSLHHLDLSGNDLRESAEHIATACRMATEGRNSCLISIHLHDN